MNYSSDRHEALQQFTAFANNSRNITINSREQYDAFLKNVLGFTERNREYTADLSDIDQLAYLKEAAVSLDAIQAKLTEAETRLGITGRAQQSSSSAARHQPVPVAVETFSSNTPDGILSEFLATMKNMPERFATTELFLETFKRWEDQKAEFLALSDAGHMDAMDGDPRWDEVIALVPTMQRKLNQYDRDFAQAKMNRVRRTAWDAVLRSDRRLHAHLDCAQHTR